VVLMRTMLAAGPGAACAAVTKKAAMSKNQGSSAVGMSLEG
jgi:hypothetical protein